MVFSRCDSIFILTLPFIDRFDEMGFVIQFMWDGWIGLEDECSGSLNSQTHGVLVCEPD